jgi:hypothetical protein
MVIYFINRNDAHRILLITVLPQINIFKNNLSAYIAFKITFFNIAARFSYTITLLHRQRLNK